MVPVSELMGKTRADVMPPITTNERWAAWIDSISFSLFGLVSIVHHLRILRGRRADERDAWCSSARWRSMIASTAAMPVPILTIGLRRCADSRVQRREGH